MGLDFVFFSLNSLFFLPEFFAVDAYTGKLRLYKRYGKRKQLRTGCRAIKLRPFEESIDFMGSQFA
jgi:hypothetical protein